MRSFLPLLLGSGAVLLACGAVGDEDVGASADEVSEDSYGFASEPPTRALADTYYAFDLRTAIGACATDRVEWTLDDAPAGAKLTLAESKVSLAKGQKRAHEKGGADREAAKVEWDLGGVAPGTYTFRVKWRAWTDCGALRSGKWGPEVTQSWSLEVRPNRWYSGDLHVHTKHSERDESSGSVYDYYQRAVNGKTDDAGRTFASRSRDSLRGRLHWLVFSDHTNNEMEECGRHFPKYCQASESMEEATGRDVVKHYTEESKGDVLLVVGSEISNKNDGHFGFLPKNPFPNPPIYAPGYSKDATNYDHDSGSGPGVFRERWVDGKATNAEEIALIHEMNGLAIVNHEDGFTKNWTKYDWTSTDFDGLEVWNGANRHDKWDDSAYNGGIDFNPVSKHDRLSVDIPENPIHRSYIGMLKHGRWPFALVGGSDAHDYNEVVCGGAMCDPTNAEVASPMTTVWADDFVWTNGKTGVLDGIAKGRVVVHDTSNFIDLRVTYEGKEYMLGDTIEDYVPGTTLSLRAIGHAGPFIDGDNRVLLMLGTNGDESSRNVDVLYNSEDATHFVKKAKGKDHMRYIRPETSFDRSWDVKLDATQLGRNKTFFLWSQFIPWHSVTHFWGNGRDMVQTGAIRVKAR
ncbi:MAG: hypothetical protein KIT84_29535 [Labilithrix sp.]|nr:hypothetical protein [Labilithrix sp.]MCW5815206.1 hypothetical protein [Labilithrix sp.]